MQDEEITPLAHQFLLAMPHMEDDFFKASVVYLWNHDQEGSRGLVINQPSDLRVDALLQNIGVAPSKIHQQLRHFVLSGGPVQIDRGYILHSEMLAQDLEGDAPSQNQPVFAASQSAGHGLQVTVSKDVLDALSEGAEPTHMLLALGYCSWEQGQLVQELAQNQWLTIPATDEQAIEWLFQTLPEDCYQTVLSSIGLQSWQLTACAGRA